MHYNLGEGINKERLVMRKWQERDLYDKGISDAKRRKGS